MAVELDNLFVALVFLLPGFLTSRLIAARTPAMGRVVSTFQETLESLLRSVYIHLFIAPFFFTIVWYFFVRNDAYLLNLIYREGLQACYVARPFESSILLFGWLLTSFCLAVTFGYKWDPLEVLFSNLANKTGTNSKDMFYQLREYAVDKRNKGLKDNQLWIQARLKNGYTYRGEFDSVGYRRDGLSRELRLANVSFFPYPAQVEGEILSNPKLYSFVILDLDNCQSLEVLFGRNPSPKNEKA